MTVALIPCGTGICFAGLALIGAACVTIRMMAGTRFLVIVIAVCHTAGRVRAARRVARATAKHAVQDDSHDGQ